MDQSKECVLSKKSKVEDCNSVGTWKVLSVMKVITRNNLIGDLVFPKLQPNGQLLVLGYAKRETVS